MKLRFPCLGWSFFVAKLSALRLLLAFVGVMFIASAAQATQTVPDGKWWTDANGTIWYLRSSMNNLLVGDGYNQGTIIDNYAQWFFRSGETVVAERVPYVGFNTGSYWSSGSFYTYYRVWTDGSTGYQWGTFTNYANIGGTWYYQWGGAKTVNIITSGGKYLGYFGGLVTTSATSPGTVEEFALWPTQGGALKDGDEVVLATRNTARILTAEYGGGDAVYANREYAGTWERFRIYKMSGGDNYIRSGDSVSFKTSGNYYWCAENGGGYDLNATRLYVGTWETFTLSEVTPISR